MNDAEYIKIINSLPDKEKRQAVESIRKNILASKIRLLESQINELNLNTKKNTERVLSLPISCGFEAEILWPYSDTVEVQYDIENFDDATNEQVLDFIYAQFDQREKARSAVRNFSYYYDTWKEEKEQAIFNNIMLSHSDDILNDEDLILLYAEEFIDINDIKQYKKQTIEKTGNSHAQWKPIDWIKDFIKRFKEQDFKGWHRKQYQAEYQEIKKEIKKAVDEFTMHDYVSERYQGEWDNAFKDMGLNITSDRKKAKSRLTHELVADFIKEWSSKNSSVKGVDVKDIDTATNYTKWTVDKDVSVYGTGMSVEIVSPAFNTPQKMIEEMKTLFEYLGEKNIKTNETTGLHVTMSLNTDTTVDLNPLKLVLLLKDQYLLQQFKRRINEFTPSQQDSVEKYAKALLDANEVDTKDIRQLEKVLMAGISAEKYTSVNFKKDEFSQKPFLNDRGNQLIEFRIAGNAKYHLNKNFDKIKSSIVKYASALNAAYDPEQYKKEYIKSIVKVINKAKEGLLDADAAEIASQERIDQRLLNNDFVKVIKKLSIDYKKFKDYVGYIGEIESIMNDSEPDPKYAKVLLDKFMVRVVDGIVKNNLPFKLSSQESDVIRSQMNRFNLTNQEIIKKLPNHTEYKTSSNKKEYLQKFARVLGIITRRPIKI